MIAHLTFGQEHDDRSAKAVADGMELRVQPAFGAPDTSGKSPPPLLQAGRCPVGIEVRRVDHDPVGLARFARQFDEYPVEYPQAAPADEAVVDRLVRAIIPGRIAPHQTVLDDVDDA